MKTPLPIAWILCLFTLLSGCGIFNKGIRVGSKGATEHQLLGEIIAQTLEKANLKVERRLSLGDSSMLQAAVISGDLDLYPEDSLSTLTLTLKETPIMDPTAVYERIRSEYARQFGLRVLPYLGASNETVMLVLKSLAQKEAIETMSAAAASKVPWQLGVTGDFSARGESQSQLAVVYKLQQRSVPLTLAGSELYKALKDGQVNMITGTRSDALIADPELQPLEDDQRVFPPSHYFIMTRDSAFSSHPGLEAALARLAGKISTEDLSRMLRSIEVSKQDPAAVAKDFLARAGL